MSNLSNITDKIIEDANKKAVEIIANANSEAKNIYEFSKNEVQSKYKEIIESAKNQASVRTERIIAAAELEGKKQVLSTKQEIITQAFDKSVEGLVKLSDGEYDALIAKMADGIEGETVKLPKETGGFIVKRGNVELNFSFKALALKLKENLEKEIVSILFG